MISALRKIEGRGELARANSAVMEMCIDNPRVGFSNVFDTHPPIDARVGAIVKFMGGHDPGPIALPDVDEPHDGEDGEDQPEQEGPWGSSPNNRPVATSRSCRPGRRSKWAAPPRPPAPLPRCRAPGDRAGRVSGAVNSIDRS